MEASIRSLYQRQPPRLQLTRGMAWSLSIHLMLGVLTLVVPGILPKRAVPLPFYTVELVSLDQGGPKDGNPLAGGAGKPAAGKAAASKAHAPIPVMPVERLRSQPQSVSTLSTPLKKLSSAVQPDPTTKTSSAAIDKNLDKLIHKPKQPKDTQPPQVSDADQKATGSASHDQREASGKTTKVTDGKQSGNAGRAGEAAGTAAGTAAGAAGGGGTGTAAGGDSAQIGLARRLYYAEVWNIIRREWSLDTTRLKGQHLEAVIIVVIRRDGKVLSYRFEKKSGNALLDESAERAVRKADTLPPFPKIYSPPQEELGIRFRPEDLG
jgi:colicin import membrane protein